MEHRIASLCLALVGAACLAASAMAQPVQLTIIDRDGTEVGRKDGGLVLVRLDESTIVAIQLGPKTVEGDSGKIWQDITRVIPTTGPGAVYFSEANCSGTAYISYLNLSELGAQPAGTVADADGGRATVYIGKPGYPVRRHLASRLESGHVCSNGSYRDSVIPVVNVVDLSARYRVPFTLK
jgi:hypothetical protein